MASQGPLSAGTGANMAGIGTLTWNNPGNVTDSDDTRTSVVLGTNGVSRWLKVTNFGFTLPVDAVVDGILVEIERSGATGATVIDNSLKIVQAGSPAGTDHASGTLWQQTTDRVDSYGGSSDLWGLSWTAAQINAADFGVAISATNVVSGNARVDYVRITVYYTEANSPQQRQLRGLG